MPSGVSDWTDPPSLDQLELTLIGPGFGETALVHLGSSRWLIVDSCIAGPSDEPTALRYLRGIGINPATAVSLILATHWHDDHIRGMARLIKACPNARFSCSSAMLKDEFQAMIEAFNQQPITRAGSGATEIRNVFDHLEQTERATRFASSARPLLTLPIDLNVHGRPVTITALSPSDEAIKHSLRDIAELMPGTVTKHRATARNPNHLSVALWIEVGTTSLLLGADLENTSDPKTGWKAVISDTDRPQGKACVFKVPHHGSLTGFLLEVHTEMLMADPIAVLTPWALGASRLPNKTDVSRILTTTPDSYITAPPRLSRSRRPRPNPVRAELRERGIKLFEAQPRAGAIRIRNGGNQDWDTWTVELKPPASRLCELRLEPSKRRVSRSSPRASQTRRR